MNIQAIQKKIADREYLGHEGVETLRMDLEAALGISGHPKRKTIFNRAWEMGCGSGMMSVVLCYVTEVNRTKIQDSL